MSDQPANTRKILVCRADELKDGGSAKFVIPEPKFDREGFIVRHDGSLRAYYNECPHITLPLDWNDNDFYSLDHTSLVCKNHGAMFRPEDGFCTVGPCHGTSLKPISVVVENTAAGEMIFALLP